MFRTGSFVLAFLIVFSAATSAQNASHSSSSQLQTAWGDPDLQGVWDFRTLTPLERPDEFKGKAFLTEEEAAVFEQQTLEERDMDRRDGAEISAGLDADVDRAYNQFWWDFGTEISENRRTSLITDPPDGKIPWTPEGIDRNAALFAILFGNVPEGPEDRALSERCILGFNSGPPMLPSAYNNNVQVLQTPDHVVIYNEMVHNVRVVPLNDEPHLSADLRQWVGDSRGHWEGDTLVVETTNFLSDTQFPGSSANLHLIERFTRIDENGLLYEFTPRDPEIWTSPWTAAVPMKRSDAPMFEYACHEGNYGMTNLLAGARAEERDAENSIGSR
jgi:hypothetical protein